ncbi:MAG: endonuclease/exonuclease/phosphatase family protein [Actinomycetes bacterium]
MGGSLKVWSWNVLADAYLHLDYYPHLGSAPDPVARHVAIGDVTVELAETADVICLQEVDEKVAGVVAHRLVDWETTWVPRPGGRPDGSLVATPARTRARHRGLEVLGRRSAAIAEVDVDGTRVLVASTHVSWAPANEPDHPGVEEVEELVQLLDTSGPLVVAGDFNDSSGGPVLMTFNRLGFSRADNSEPTAFVNGEGRVIDHVVGRGIDLTGELGRWPADRPLPDDEFPSDHVPIAARGLLQVWLTV